ncbi:MAG TPA: BON domain-containing protein [Pseudomonas sp.]|nr:BON domain-containing protein [Pseudomonas sp.]
MHQLKKLALATAAATLLGLTSLLAQAADGDVSAQLKEARQEGSLWTAYALNRHLNPFTIDVDVEQGTAILTGTVESEVDRELAEQVALGIEGIRKVDNKLLVDAQYQPKVSSEPSLSQRFDDATLTATVKSKLLWNRSTEGLDIDVDTQNGVVSLSGEAQSAEAKELAGRLADNTDGVRKVVNDLKVSGTPSTAAKVQGSADKAGAAITDAWITSKVKSSYLYSRNLDGLDISVDTKGGLVTLSGMVNTPAEKDLAIEMANNIRGVRSVNADALKVAS